MQEDFHYYATYCAAFLSGFSHQESMDICYSAQFVDLCSKTLLSKLKAPALASTTMLQFEMMDTRTDLLGLQEITRIWSSFHFLPRDLYAVKKRHGRRYMEKYRLICGPNGDLVKMTVELAKDTSLQHAGIAMHVLADTWAHSYFAGTPSLVINNIDGEFYELIEEDGEEKERRVKFIHSPSASDDPENGVYINTPYQGSEDTVMNLGHGRAGHFPDYSFARYRYLPAWGDYMEIEKDNPHDYNKAFSQMVYALKYLRGELDSFATDRYDADVMVRHGERIDGIIRQRRLSASDDWKRFGEELSGCAIDDFDIEKYQKEYVDAPEGKKEYTFLGRFFSGAMLHKGMVTDQIYRSKNRLAGFSKNRGKARP